MATPSSSTPATSASTLPSSSFMNWFWDLASDDQTKRLYAGTMIIKHITSSTPASASESLSTDGEYALKRLIRGVSSSRDSARQGFSACLCQLYIAFPGIEMNKIISLIEESTKPTGPMKGSEERDVMFGKLFNFLALIRAGRIQNDSTTGLYILDRFIELHKRKGWIREVVSEAILLLFEVLPRDDSSVLQSALQKLKFIVDSDELEEMSACDLILFSGLQTLAHKFDLEGFSKLSEAIQKVVPTEPIFSPESFSSIENTLLNACHGFPKIHRVWTSLVFAIFGCSEGRSLPPHRLTHLSVAQLALLTKYMDFITTKLLPIGGSHERKSVAYHLIIDLIKLVPTTSLPLVLTQHVVRNLMNVRFNQKNTLHELSRHILKEIVVASSYPCSPHPQQQQQDTSVPYVKLTIANILTASGSAEFDNVTQTTTIATLLSELNLEMILEYIESLCDVLKSSLLLTSTASVIAPPSNDEQDQQQQQEENVTDPSSCIYSLYAIIKNPKLVERGTITAVILAILLRLSCYGQGITPELELGDKSETKKKKKSSKKSSSSSASPSMMTSILTANGISVELASRIVTLVRRVEGAVQEPYLPSETPTPVGTTVGVGVVALVRAARSRFLTMLSELTYQTIDGLNKSPEAREKTKEKEEDDHHEKETNVGPTFLQFANILIEFFETVGLSTHKQLTTASSLMELEDEEAEEKEGNSTVKDLLRELKETMSEMRGLGPDVIPLKLLNSFEVLLIHTTFHILCSDEIDVEPLRVMLIVLPQILEKYKNKGKTIASAQRTNSTSASAGGDDDEEDDDEDDDPQAELLDCCIDLLAVSASHSIKGIRDAIKKIWMSIIHFCGLHQDGLEAVLLAVIADDTMNDDDEEEEGDDEGEEEEDDDEPEGEEGQEKGEEDESEEEDDDEDDEGSDGDETRGQKRQVTEEEVVKLLEDEDLDLGEDDEDLEDALVHVESADDALVQMIKMRKQSRKQGLLQAKRQEYIIRSRAIDILEIFLHRNENSTMIIPLFRPLLFCLKKVSSSSICQSLPEGRTFQQRLKSLIETKLNKLKFSLAATEGSVEFDQFMTKVTGDALDFCTHLFTSPDTSLRNLSYQTYFTITRSILNGKNSNILHLWKENYSSLITNHFYLHKNHFLNSLKILDEYFVRFPDVIVEILLEVLVEAMVRGKTSYLQGEAYRLLEMILKKYSQLNERNKFFILEKISNIMRNIFQLFTVYEHSLISVSAAADGTVPTEGGEGQEDSPHTNSGSKKGKKGKGKSKNGESDDVGMPSPSSSLPSSALKVKRFKPLLQLMKTLCHLFNNKSVLHCQTPVTLSTGAATPVATIYELRCATTTSPSVEQEEEGKKKKSKKGDTSSSTKESTGTVVLDPVLIFQMKEFFVKKIQKPTGEETSEGEEDSTRRPFHHLIRWIQSNMSLKSLYDQIAQQIQDIPLPAPSQLPAAMMGEKKGKKTGKGKSESSVAAAATAVVTSGGKENKKKRSGGDGDYQRDYEREFIQSVAAMQMQEAGKSKGKRARDDETTPVVAAVSPAGVGGEGEMSNEKTSKKAKKEKKKSQHQ